MNHHFIFPLTCLSDRTHVDGRSKDGNEIVPSANKYSSRTLSYSSIKMLPLFLALKLIIHFIYNITTNTDNCC